MASHPHPSHPLLSHLTLQSMHPNPCAGMTDLVFTHITAKLPGSNAFLINPYGLLFDEITASSLVKIDDKCNKLQVSPPSTCLSGVNVESASIAETPAAAASKRRLCQLPITSHLLT